MDFSFPQIDSVPLTHVNFRGCSFDMLRLDLLDKQGTGNKFFKLKYNFQDLVKSGIRSAATFGGAFSNHIAAFAEIGHRLGIKTAGIIRGERMVEQNPTLIKAEANGMILFYMNRTDYRNKDITSIGHDLKAALGEYRLIPEGGSSVEGVKGAAEIMDFVPDGYGLVCCPVGTGGTLAGLINSGYKADFLGFSSLKGAFSLQGDIENKIAERRGNWKLNHDFSFGGYAKMNDELFQFMKDFHQETSILLDPVYNAKAVFGLCQLLRTGQLADYKNILTIHTGGLQGIEGMGWLNERYAYPTF